MRNVPARLLARTGLLLMALTAPAAAESLTLYVATNGNDHWSGRFALPNAAGTDGPLASLVGARDAIRRARAGAAGGLGAATVRLGLVTDF